VGRNLRSRKEFERWLASEGVESTLDELASCPSLLDALLRAFGRALYGGDRPYSVYVYGITALQARFPTPRRSFPLSWDLALTWHHLEPTEHRTPVPVSVLRGVVSVALLWGWFRFAAVVSCVFFGVFRPGEVFCALRSSLVLPVDVPDSAVTVAYLGIPTPKTRRRGGGRQQYAAIHDALCVALLSAVFARVPLSSSLFGASSSSFRRRWDAALAALGVPRGTFSPGGLRGGGAIAHFALHQDISLLMWQMRIQGQQTLSAYLQEVTVHTSLAALPALCRQRLRAASAWHDPLIRFACLRLTAGDWRPIRVTLLSL